MSADDCIFVLESPSECLCGAGEDNLHKGDCPVAWGNTEYRVAHVTGAYWESEDEMTAAFVKKGTPVFYDKGKALIRAHEMDEMDEMGYRPEYGVRLIRSKQPVRREKA